MWRHAAVFAWSDLISDRSRKLVSLQSTAAFAARAGDDSGPNFENYDLSTPSSRTPGAVLTPVRGRRTGMSTSGVGFLGFV